MTARYLHGPYSVNRFILHRWPYAALIIYAHIYIERDCERKEGILEGPGHVRVGKRKLKIKRRKRGFGYQAGNSGLGQLHDAERGYHQVKLFVTWSPPRRLAAAKHADNPCAG